MASELTKSVSVILPLDDWRRLRDEAARRGIPVAQLIRESVDPLLARLRRKSPRRAA